MGYSILIDKCIFAYKVRILINHKVLHHLFITQFSSLSTFGGLWKQLALFQQK